MDNPTTNKAAWWEKNLPPTVSSLRHKLGQDAKQQRIRGRMEARIEG